MLSEARSDYLGLHTNPRLNTVIRFKAIHGVDLGRLASCAPFGIYICLTL